MNLKQTSLHFVYLFICVFVLFIYVLKIKTTVMHLLMFSFLYPVLLIQNYQVYSTRRFCFWHGGMLNLQISVALFCDSLI